MYFLRKRHHSNIQFIKHLRNIIALGIFALLLSSCSGEPTDALPTLVEFPTGTATSAVQATDVAQVQETEEPVAGTQGGPISVVTEEVGEGFVTEEVQSAGAVTEQVASGLVTQQVEAVGQQTQEPAETPDVFQPAEDIRYQTEDGELFVVVTTVNTASTVADLPEAPDGQKFVLLSTTLANFTGEPIVVEGSSFTLIDREFNRYPAYEPEDYLRIPLIGAELNGSTTMLGTVRFAIDDDAIPYLLEWCPFNDCEVEVLQTLLP